MAFMDLDPQPKLSSLRCPFCHGSLYAEAARSCEGCHTPLHGECWLESGGCPTLGCERLVLPPLSRMISWEEFAREARPWQEMGAAITWTSEERVLRPTEGVPRRLRAEGSGSASQAA